MINRGVNRAKISGPARKYFVRPGPELILYITKFVQWFKYFGGPKTQKILLSMGIISDLISVQLQTY